MRGRCLTDRPAVVRQKRSPRTRTDSRVVTALEVTLALLDDLHWGSALEKLGWRGEGLLASALNRDSSAGGISVTRQRWRALKPAIVQLNDHTTRHAIDSNHVRSRPISEGNPGLEGTNDMRLWGPDRDRRSLQNARPSRSSCCARGSSCCRMKSSSVVESTTGASTRSYFSNKSAATSMGSMRSRWLCT